MNDLKYYKETPFLRPNKTLRLTIKKRWFDMIVSGEKTEEYRERKGYWLNRIHYNQLIYGRFERVEFINGYRKESPRATFELMETRIGKGKKRWGADLRRKYFIIMIGKRIDL